MSRIDVQELSAPDALNLMKTLGCLAIGSFISPGSPNCIAARQAAKATPIDVGMGEDTIPFANQRFATVCTTCPVLLAALANFIPSQ